MRWCRSLTVVPVGNKAKRLWSVNHTTNTMHHHHHHHHHQRYYAELVAFQKPFPFQILFQLTQRNENIANSCLGEDEFVKTREKLK